MIEVFTTNIPNQHLAKSVMESLEKTFPQTRITFDAAEGFIMSYPCNHSILRVEGESISTETICSMVNKLGFVFDILEDKVCKD